MEKVEQISEPECTPRRFWEIPLLWLKFWIMDEKFFQNEKSHVDILNTIFGFVLFVAILPLVQLLFNFLCHHNNSTQFIINKPWFDPNSGNLIPDVYFKGLFLFPIFLYFGNFLIFILARLFGGKGNFSTQAYFFSLVNSPIQIITTLIYFPVLVPFFSTFLYSIFRISFQIFSFLITIRSFKVAHNISFLRAFLIVSGFLISLQILKYL